jgi:hypothetical protein
MESASLSWATVRMIGWSRSPMRTRRVLKNILLETPSSTEPNRQMGLGHFGCQEVLDLGPGDKQLKDGEIHLEERAVGGSSVDVSDTVSDKCRCCSTLSTALRVKARRKNGARSSGTTSRPVRRFIVEPLCRDCAVHCEWHQNHELGREEWRFG